MEIEGEQAHAVGVGEVAKRHPEAIREEKQVQEGIRKVLLGEGEREEVLSVAVEEGGAKSEELRVRAFGGPMIVGIPGLWVAAEGAGALGDPLRGVGAARLDDV